ARRADRPVRSRCDLGVPDEGPAADRDRSLAFGAVPEPARGTPDPPGMRGDRPAARRRRGHPKAGESPHVPALVRHPLARGGRRRAGRPGATGPRERGHHPGLYAGDQGVPAGGLLHVPPAGTGDQEGLRVIEPAKLAELREALDEQRENLRKEIAEQGGDPDSDDAAIDVERGFADSAHSTAERARLLSVMKAL